MLAQKGDALPNCLQTYNNARECYFIFLIYCVHDYVAQTLKYVVACLFELSKTVHWGGFVTCAAIFLESSENIGSRSFLVNYFFTSWKCGQFKIWLLVR